MSDNQTQTGIISTSTVVMTSEQPTGRLRYKVPKSSSTKPPVLQQQWMVTTYGADHSATVYKL